MMYHGRIQYAETMFHNAWGVHSIQAAKEEVLFSELNHCYVPSGTHSLDTSANYL